MKRLYAWTLLASSLMGSSAFVLLADDEPKKPDTNQSDDLFKKLDKNGDGKLVPDEISDEQGRFFDRLVRLGDKDDNGELTRAEFDAALKDSDVPVQGGGLDRRPGGPGGPGGPMIDPKQMLERLDKNKDGKLTKDELPEEGPGRFLREMLQRSGKEAFTAEDLEQARQRFGQGQPGGRLPEPAEVIKRLDKNNDGKLTKDEIPEEGPARMLREMLERSGKDSLTAEDLERGRQRLMQAGGPGGPFGRPNPEEMFKRMDSNGDGKVTLEEIPEPFRDRVKPLFNRADKKELTLEDFRALGPRPDGERREGERGREGERRPEAERRAEGERRDGERDRDGERRPPEGGRRPEGERRDGERKPGPDGERRPDRERREGERRPDEEGRRPLPRFFEILDRNRDGRISRDELDGLREAFGDLDRNRDGQLDPAELLGPPPEGRGPDGRPPEGRPGPEGRPRPDGDRGPDARREPPRGEGERRPEGDRRPPEGERRRDGDRRPPEGERRDGDRRPPEGERRRDGERRPEAERPEGRPPRPETREGERRRDEDKEEKA